MTSHVQMQKAAWRYQQGFTLIELMVVIAIIAILSAVGIPAYQNYVQKAAMTDLLQAIIPYKTAVELCAFEQGELTKCNSGDNGIPKTKGTQYVETINVQQGVISANGRQTLKGLTAIITPTLGTEGDILWQRQCRGDASLVSACNSVLRFSDTDSTP